MNYRAPICHLLGSRLNLAILTATLFVWAQSIFTLLSICSLIVVPVPISQAQLLKNESVVSTSPNSRDIVISSVIETNTSLYLSTVMPSISTTSPTRIYFERGTLQKSDSIGKMESSSNQTNHSNQNKNQASVQVYIIIFIGILPAAISAFVWWVQNMKNRCFRSKSPSSTSSTNSQSSVNYDIEKLSHSLMKGGKNKATVDQLAYQIAKRAEMLSNEQNLPYSGYRANFVKSRRVYSLEVPRKCIEMVEILGEGNFGQVWKAKTYQFGGKFKPNIVAVKTNKVNSGVEQQEDLLKELDIMLQLGPHPNVVRLLGCCTENEPYYLVMEYVSQGKLLSYLRYHRSDAAHYFQTNSDWGSKEVMCNNNYMTYCTNNGYGFSEGSRKCSTNNENLSPIDLIQFIYQICKGMEFISSYGIIHRDLAARNILIDENKNCKVADFGLSRNIRDKENERYEMKHGGQMPIRWMSPEALSMGLFSIKSDVWALGILMWEIVTLGSTPYVGMSASEVINFIRQGNICSQPDHCSDNLYELMKSCWAYRAENRLSFAEIKHSLVEMLLDVKEEKSNYIDLEHFNNSLYYFKANEPTDEKL